MGIDVTTTANDEVQKIFDEMDEDGNGSIEREEMYNHLVRTKRVSNMSNKVEEPTSEPKGFPIKYTKKVGKHLQDTPNERFNLFTKKS